MIEELNKNLEILELERIKEILPEYVHKNSKDMHLLQYHLSHK